MKTHCSFSCRATILLTFAAYFPLAIAQADDLGKLDSPKSKAAQKTAAAPGDKPADGAKGRAVKDNKPAGDDFIRIVKLKGEPAAMQTSILRYQPAPGSKWADKQVTVDLIGAVHVGEGSYYKALNLAFAKYDAMLFELVAPEGTRIPKGGGNRKGGNPISALQSGMKNALGLKFQLEEVDYTKANFVHADMSPQEMAASMKKRGESVLQMMMRMMAAGFVQQSKGQTNDLEIIMALFAKDRTMRLKRVMAKQVLDMETLNNALAGEDGSSTLIGERNRKALEVMVREVERSGKRRIAIFYGAGHLPDFDRRLKAEFGMKRVGQPTWLTAWDLTK